MALKSPGAAKPQFARGACRLVRAGFGIDNAHFCARNRLAAGTMFGAGQVGQGNHTTGSRHPDPLRHGAAEFGRNGFFQCLAER